MWDHSVNKIVNKILVTLKIKIKINNNSIYNNYSVDH